MAKSYILVGSRNTELEGMIFSVCTSRKNAEEAKRLSFGDDSELEIVETEFDSIDIDNKLTKFPSFDSVKEDDIHDLLDNTAYAAKDEIYRYLWSQHVKEDVESHAEEIGVDLDEGEIDVIVDRYVYQGDYDCNLNYWQNIENLIEDVHGSI